MSEVATEARGLRKQRKGVVVRRSGDKSIVVSVERRRQHPQYGKTETLSARFHVHDEKNEAGPNDLVRIMETRPLSKLKRWRLVEVLAKAGA